MTIWLDILCALLAIGGAVLLVWLAISRWYQRQRRDYECALVAYLAKTCQLFKIAADPNAFERDYLDVGGGVCLALYILRGHPDAPVYVFMPGTAVYAQLYTQLLADLHARGWTVVAYDPRGHGRSGKRRGMFTIPQMIDDACQVAAYARRRFGKKVVFSGSSQGGVVSLYVAATNSPDVATVVCHDIAWLDGNTIREVSILKPPLFLMPFLIWLFSAMRAWSLPVTWYLPFARLKMPDHLPGSPIKLMEKDPLATLAYSLGAIATLAKTVPAVPLDRITMPVMLVSSEGDEVFPPAYEQRIFAMLTCEKYFLLLGDLPHLMILKPPRELIDGVVAWVDAHAP